jgi:hypothetical protein
MAEVVHWNHRDGLYLTLPDPGEIAVSRPNSVGEILISLGGLHIWGSSEDAMVLARRIEAVVGTCPHCYEPFARHSASVVGPGDYRACYYDGAMPDEDDDYEDAS